MLVSNTSSVFDSEASGFSDADRDVGGGMDRDDDRAWWSDLVAGAVWEYLGELAVGVGREAGDVPAEIDRLVSAWRALLRLHGPSPLRCECCHRGRVKPVRPCGVWQVAIAYFVRKR